MRARLRADADDLCKMRDRRFEGKRSVGLKQYAERPDVERNEQIAVARFLCDRVACLLCESDACRHRFTQRVSAVMERICAEGVRFDDLRTRAEIFGVERSDFVRMRQIPRFGTLARAKSARSKHRPRSAVEQDGLFSDEFK